MATKVHIEFGRVQTWLFATPRLRAMVGANSLLGEALRVDLPALATTPEDGSWALAARSAPAGASLRVDDPLAAAAATNSARPYPVTDDPARDMARGIVSRDGGHFEAYFAHGDEAFAEAGARLLRRNLPGLQFRIRIDGKDYTPERGPEHELSAALPVLSPCEWSSQGFASVLHAPKGDDPVLVSSDVKRRIDAAKKEHPADVAALLTRAMPEFVGDRRPQELEKLAGGQYLAVIHADGNNIGDAVQDKDDTFRARFHHRNRVLTRNALRYALGKAMTTASSPSPPEFWPVLPLMLGGDDMLVLCRAPLALDFVVDLCRRLDELHGQLPETEREPKLTLGIGVAIAPFTMPFYRLHAVAEQLAASAKRLYRGLEREEKAASVVDWAVYTASWMDDPAHIRARDWVVKSAAGDRRILSRRPMPVLDRADEAQPLASLDRLVEGAKNLSKAKAPRSQLRFLVDQLAKGKVLAELAYAELSPAAKKGLEAAGVPKETPWQGKADQGFTSSVLDLVEIFEIGRLGAHRPQPSADLVQPPA